MTSLRTRGWLGYRPRDGGLRVIPNLYYTNKLADDDTNLQYSTANFLIRGGSSR